MILRDNGNTIRNFIVLYEKKIQAEIKNALSKGMRKFEGEMINQQMSGRKGKYFGLNTITGRLKGSWKVLVSGTGLDTTVKLASSSKYSRIHQFGGMIIPKYKKVLHFIMNGGPIFAQRVYIPKRLYILENFVSNGRNTIMSYVREGLKSA